MSDSWPTHDASSGSPRSSSPRMSPLQTQDTSMWHASLSKGLGSAARSVAAALALVAGLAAGCNNEPVELQQLRTTVDYQAMSQSSESDLESRLLEDLEEADTRIWAAVTPDVLTPAVQEALLAAHDRDVEVQVVADVDAPKRNDTLADRFGELEEAGIRVVYGDGPFRYLPSPNLSQALGGCKVNDREQYTICSTGIEDSPCPGETAGNANAVCRPGAYNLMSHRFFIIDKENVWNFANGFEGSIGPVGWEAESELIHEDFGREFRQMEGGIFADSLDTYNGPVKSRTDEHIDYMYDGGVMKIRFNPQERLMKNVIDAVYSARSSVHVVTSELTNPFLLDALEYKAKHDFQVSIAVGADTQPSGSARERLRQLGANAYPTGDDLPTMVLIDVNRDANDKQWPRAAMMLTHPLWHGQPLSLEPPKNPYVEDATDRVFVYPSDHYVDGSLSMFYEFSSNAGRMDAIDRSVQYVTSVLQQSEGL